MTMTSSHFHQSPAPPAESDEQLATYPSWYHDLQVRSTQERIDADIRQRAALVEWIASIDERVSKNTLQIHEHRQALTDLGCTRVTFGDGTQTHLRGITCPVHPDAEDAR